MAKKATKVGNGQPPQIQAGDATRILNVHPDLPDLRDRTYQPALLDLLVEIGPPHPAESPILDQGVEGACTGFALAGAINLLRSRRSILQQLPAPSDLVSSRMLYEHAKLHDEWPGEAYEGSSIRGALKGFFHNGVCEQRLAPYVIGQKNWRLTIEQARDARNTGLGAYYRLRPEIIDYHAALNEVGAVYVSARTHRGWSNPRNGEIAHSTVHEGGHAFFIVGYNADGFLIQNSWGPRWGGYQGFGGIALWTYADWAENILDAWVLRLAVPTPDAFDLTHVPVQSDSASSARFRQRPTPRRKDILGHVIHLDDGELVEAGRYATSLDTIRETAKFLKKDARREEPKYDHLVFYAHGGLNSAKASARRIRAMKPVFKRNRIYPIHFMWETGFSEEIGDIFGDIFRRSEARVGFIPDALDWTIEQTSRGVGLRLWREMKRDASRPFERNAGGWAAVRELLKVSAASPRPLKIHMVGHSAGSILLGELIRTWSALAGGEAPPIASVSLLAPACTTDFYDNVYRPAIGTGNVKGIIKNIVQYNLIDTRERDDTVGPYRKSLLYLVSNAFEEKDKTPLLGMETGVDSLIARNSLPKRHTIHYAGRNSSRTDSTTHGGFDNDRATMNDVLTTILGKKPKRSLRFQPDEMEGY
ncbi:C1 family peptidase [Bauldia sp.]|uniref:C1 family peptidase n=1 Tax=Bauldia sp. TaxID=2575872 RepID=UPI003BACC558